MSAINFNSVSKAYGDVQVVKGLDLTIHDGELLALLGPSGCGKTTTLRMLAGFVDVTSGQIFFGERDVTRLPSYRRNTGMVFQGYALFPHMSVAQNVAFGLERRGVARAEVQARVREALAMVHMGEFGDRLPRQLSGGQQQRIALARAMVIRPDVLLLDEPLSALDAKLRLDVRKEIRKLQQEQKVTTLFVTHDQDEALTMADRLVVMNRGRVEQIGTPEDVYESPQTRFVADFLGRSNFLTGDVTEAGVFTARDGTRLAFRSGWQVPNTKALLAFRPEKVTISPNGSAGEAANALSGHIVDTLYSGSSTEVSVRLASGETIVVTRQNSEARRGDLTPGHAVTITWPSEATVVVSDTSE